MENHDAESLESYVPMIGLHWATELPEKRKHRAGLLGSREGNTQLQVGEGSKDSCGDVKQSIREAWSRGTLQMA